MLQALLQALLVVHCVELCELSNARTYARTHKELLTLIFRLT